MFNKIVLGAAFALFSASVSAEVSSIRMHSGVVTAQIPEGEMVVECTSKLPITSVQEPIVTVWDDGIVHASTYAAFDLVTRSPSLRRLHAIVEKACDGLHRTDLHEWRIDEIGGETYSATPVPVDRPPALEKIKRERGDVEISFLLDEACEPNGMLKIKNLELPEFGEYSVLIERHSDENLKRVDRLVRGVEGLENKIEDLLSDDYEMPESFGLNLSTGPRLRENMETERRVQQYLSEGASEEFREQVAASTETGSISTRSESRTRTVTHNRALGVGEVRSMANEQKLFDYYLEERQERLEELMETSQYETLAFQSSLIVERDDFALLHSGDDFDRVRNLVNQAGDKGHNRGNLSFEEDFDYRGRVVVLRDGHEPEVQGLQMMPLIMPDSFSGCGN